MKDLLPYKRGLNPIIVEAIEDQLLENHKALEYLRPLLHTKLHSMGGSSDEWQWLESIDHTIETNRRYFGLERDKTILPEKP